MCTCMCTCVRTSVPDLRSDRLSVDLNATGGKLDPDGRSRLQVELIPREARQEVGLAHSRIANQYNCSVVKRRKGLTYVLEGA